MRLLDSSHRIPRFLHWIKSVRNPHYFLRYHSLPQNWKINLFPSMHCRPIILENCHPSACTVDLWYHCNIHHSIYLQLRQLSVLCLSIGNIFVTQKFNKQHSYSYHYLCPYCRDYCAFQLHLGNILGNGLVFEVWKRK